MSITIPFIVAAVCLGVGIFTAVTKRPTLLTPDQWFLVSLSVAVIF